MSKETRSIAKINEQSAWVPPGVILPFGGASAPQGWLLCHGQAISRTDYAELFAAIGTTFGVGDGSTTFNLPDMRGRAPVGKDNMGGTPANRLTGAWADSIGGADGAEGHTLAEGEIPSHAHAPGTLENLNFEVDGWYGVAVQSGSGISVAQVPNSFGSKIGPSSTGLKFGGATSGTGGGGEHNNVQPSLTVNYIIKT